jgi:hypothetical protein
MVVRIEKMTIDVSIEDDAEAGEKAFARLYDKYTRLREERQAMRADQAASMARDRALSPEGGRR